MIDARVTSQTIAQRQVDRIDYVSERDGLADWALMLGDEQSDTWAVYLHGHGSTGDQLLTRPDIRGLWLPAMEEAKLGILCPHLRGDAWMAPAAAADLHDLIAMLRECHGAARVLLIGGSMGGSSALAFTALHPHDVDGVIALCPVSDMPGYWRWLQNHLDGGTLSQIAQTIEQHYGATPEHDPQLFANHSALAQHARLTMPIFIGHGDADATIPVSQSRTLVAALAGKANLRYVEQAGGDHDAPLAMMPAGLKWLMSMI